MKTETTSNELVIQGIIKEVSFTDAEFIFSADFGQINLNISDITESKIRDASANKQVCFARENSEGFTLNQEYLFQIRFHRYTVRGSCVFEQFKNKQLFFSFPKKLILENLRKTDRAKVRPELSRAIPVFLRTHALHSEGSFTLEDTSAEGFGGSIKVPELFPIEIGTTVSGQLGLNEEIGKVSGKIVSAALKSEVQPGFLNYKVGIFQETDTSPLKGIENRKQARHKANLQLTLESVLHPGQFLVLDVDDISVGGFSGTPNEGSLISSVPIGSNFKVLSEKTKARLVYFSKERLHFKILRRSEVDAIAWIRKMTPFVYPGARCSSKDARELYRIFLQAGAVSNQYLKRHVLHENILVNQDAKNLPDNISVHRWFVGGSSSEADAYMSALRFSNSCWVMGDIAKASGTELDAKESVQLFFRSFSEYALSEPSIGTLMIFWVKGHPLWAKWQEVLRTQYSHLICSQTKMQYFRMVPAIGQMNSLVETVLLQKENYLERRAILGSLKPKIVTLLRNGFDFEESGTGSYALAQSSESFERIFIRVSLNGVSFLAIMNKGEIGVSVNRFIDSLFLFPLNLENDYGQLEAIVLEVANYLSHKFALVFPAVRLIHDENNELPGTEMSCLQLYPRAFFFFE